MSYYTALVVSPDGETYEQGYNDIYELIYLLNILGKDYYIADLY